MNLYKFSSAVTSMALFLLMIISCANYNKQKPKTHIIEIKGMKFIPESLKLNKGDTVVWINKDIINHDVTEVNNAWASSTLANEESWKTAITKSCSYYCSIHIVMKGKLIVKE